MKNKYEAIQNTKANIDPSGNWVDKSFAFPERTIRLGTSFSGIGAIEWAFRRLGLKAQIQFAGDIDADCKTSYLSNYGIDESRWHTDIHEFDAKPFKDQIDLFVGGAPCQAFSMRGKRGGFEDTRGTLFREFARVVMECQPKVFIFENVRGMLNHDKGNTWKVIKQVFEEDCGYQIYYQVLNAKDYGVPQSRDRIFCIGFKNETEFKYPAPIERTRSLYDYLESEFDSKYFLKQKGVNFITRRINYEKSYTQINGEIQLCQKRNQQFNWHGDFIFHPLLLSDQISPASDETVFDVSSGETNYYNQDNISNYPITVSPSGKCVMCHNEAVNPNRGRYRKLTPQECLGLMGFVPDSKGQPFKVSVPDTAAYKQAGNSIVVDVLMSLLKQMDITLFGKL